MSLLSRLPLRAPAPPRVELCALVRKVDIFRGRRGAAVLFLAPDGRALFLRRSGGVDHSGEWCLPGGTTDGAESAEATARREVLEEIGLAYKGALAEAAQLCRQEITFTTFVAHVDRKFVPKLNWEHTEYTWASLNNPPGPLHPGVDAILSTVKLRVLKGLLVDRLQKKAPRPGKAAVAELVDRLFAALERQGYVAKGDLPGHEFHGNQWTGGFGEKPTSVTPGLGKKAAVHELLSSGHPFTFDELQALTGAPDKALTNALAELKNPKWAGPKGALAIIKEGDHYFVKVNPETGKPLDTVAPKPEAAPKPEPSTAPMVTNVNAVIGQATPDLGAGVKMETSKADALYKSSLMQAANTFGMSKGTAEDVLHFKNAKAEAMAQWKANTTGIEQNIKSQNGAGVFKADAQFYKDLQAPDISTKAALDNWKTNTALEKQGIFDQATKESGQSLGVGIEPPSKTSGKASEGIPSKIVPAGYKQISSDDFGVDGAGNFTKGFAKTNSALKSNSGDSVSNKKSVESQLKDQLKDSTNFQWLKDNATKSSFSLEGRLVQNWAHTSGDGHPEAVAMQLAIRDVFGMKNEALAFDALHGLKTYGSEDGVMKVAAKQLLGREPKDTEVVATRRAMQEFVAAQYRATQADLASRGIKDVFVARGMSIGNPGAAAELITAKLQPASSFSTSFSTAKSFAKGHSVFLAKVPASQVLGTFRSGFGCTGESEVVVLAHENMHAVKIGVKNSGGSISSAALAAKSAFKGT